SRDSWFGTDVDIDEGGFPIITQRGKSQTMGSIAYLEDAAHRVEAMSKVGVDVQVLSVAPVLYGYHNAPADAIDAARSINDEIASMVERWPDRFLGYATLPLQDADASIKELDRAVNEL